MIELDHTPVKGNGNDEKPQSVKHFWNVLNPLILFALTKYLFVNLLKTKPVVLFLSFLTIGTKNRQGRLLPTNEIPNANNGESSPPIQIVLFNANGIAILPSSNGQKATSNIASQTQEEKECIINDNML